MNWKNRTIWTGDNLEIMRGMNSESVDLIYLDPPFNSNRNYSASIDSKAVGAAFKDIWTSSNVDNVWHVEIAEREPSLYAIIDAAKDSYNKSMKSYLVMMAIRLFEMKRILKSTGSIYLHCDSTSSHYLKILMDSIFTHNNFRNHIIWCYKSGGSSKRYFSKKHDIIFLYSKSDDYIFFPKEQKSYMKPYSRKNPKQTYYKDQKGIFTLVNQKDWWDDIGMLATSSKERTGYPTQKPRILLERMISASCPENGIVFDPFCGCATTLVAAEVLNMNWIGIDLSARAIDLAIQRVRNEVGELFGEITERTDIPKREDNFNPIIE